MTLIVIALGGNAFIQKGQKGTFEEQYRNIQRVSSQIADLIEMGYKVVITHGNGPQVGINMLRYEAAKNIIPPYPLHVADAETQGFLGYIIQQTLKNEILKREINTEVVAIITQVLVDRSDPAFKNPTKPVGPFYNIKQVEELKKRLPNWQFTFVKGKGYRRIVPSPKPKRIIEIDIIKELIRLGYVVIACGGGGIPVIKKNKYLAGIDAVIDKDLTSELLASCLNADELIILTDVDGIYLDFGTDKQRLINRISIAELDKLYKMDIFEEGSMKPKVEAAIKFLKRGGKRVVIGNILKLRDSILGKTGTQIYR